MERSGHFYAGVETEEEGIEERQKKTGETLETVRRPYAGGRKEQIWTES